jgi:AraC-like DNA-binding protein
VKEARDAAEMLRSPAGRWIRAGVAILWCHSPSLCGASLWGRPTGEQARELLAFFDGYEALAPRFDILLDASRVEGLDPDGVAVTLEWLRAHMQMLRTRIRARVGVIPQGFDGVTLSGIALAIGWDSPVRVVTDARAGMRILLPEGADPLSDEIGAIVERVRSAPPSLLALRGLLRAREGNVTLAEVAERLAMPARTLQRLLAEVDSSFRAEQAEARFAVASERLDKTDDKVAAIASRVGLSETGLTLLVRARTGVTPAEYRRVLRGQRSVD